jgi:zeaxanthin glucosyltransferase
MIPTLRRLLSAGHELMVAAFGDFAGDLATALPGAVLHPFQSLSSAERIQRGVAFAEHIRDPEWLSTWIETMLLGDVDRQVGVYRWAIARWQPDVVVLDPMSYAAVIACQQADVPWVALSSSLNPVTPGDWQTPLVATIAGMAVRRDEVFTQHGVAPPRFRVADAISPWLTIAFTTASYAGVSTDVHLVGAPFGHEDIEQRDRELASLPMAKGPRVYCSYGSQAFHQPRLFSRVFEACQSRGWSLIASVGDLVDDDAFVRAAPPNSVLQRYVRQLPALQRVDLVVSHGGANTVVESLWMGKPLALLTLCNDQPLQARFVERAGVGAAIDASSGDVTLSALNDAMDGALRCTSAAARLGEELRALDGPGRAAELVIRLATTRQPVQP